jgi:membrane-associated phospholipid phosphatase
MKIHDSLQKGIERLFFKGQSTERSKKVTYIIGNMILMVGIFLIFLFTFAYGWVASLHSEVSAYHLDTALDNLIPFLPITVIIYVFLFYSFVAITIIYFGLIAPDKGYAFGWSLVIFTSISIIIYIFFPVSTYWWRQDLLTHQIPGNPWAQLMYGYYEADTSLNCLPSLHAAISTAFAYAWFRYSKIKPTKLVKGVAIFAIILAIAVVLSTLFVKQHYIADEIVGVALAYVVSRFVFNKLWKSFETPSEPKIT